MKTLVFHATNFSSLLLSIGFSEGSLFVIASATISAMLAADWFDMILDRGMSR